MKGIIYKDSLNKLYDSIVWTHKIQRTYLEKLEKRRKTLSILKITFTSLSAIATTLFAIFDVKIGTIISATATMLSMVFAGVLEKVETNENIKLLRESSSTLFQLRNDLLVLSDELKAREIDDAIIKEKYLCISKIFKTSQTNIPTVPDNIVEIASKKLKVRKDEETDFSLFDNEPE